MPFAISTSESRGRKPWRSNSHMFHANPGILCEISDAHRFETASPRPVLGRGDVAAGGPKISQ